jgi:putative tryptophan/tyrosine transport system substrate-binding protein
MKRRAFITLAAGTMFARVTNVRAQPAHKIPKIGVLWHAANAAGEEPYFTALREGFRDLGYIEGGNIAFEDRFPNESPDKFKAMATELAAIPVDVLIGIGAAASPYVKAASSSIPVVFAIVPDPVGSGLVKSLARPGENATGLSTIAPELSGKRLELIKEVDTDVKRVALLVNPQAQVSRLYIDNARAAAEKLGVEIDVFQASSLNDLPGAFEMVERTGLRAMVVDQEGLFFVGRSQIARLSLEHRLITCVWSAETLRAGALLSYGPNLVTICRRIPILVQKILSGTEPAEIPVEQPTRFELGINLKTAKALGLTIPATLLARADEVIEL